MAGDQSIFTTGGRPIHRPNTQRAWLEDVGAAFRVVGRIAAVLAAFTAVLFGLAVLIHPTMDGADAIVSSVIAAAGLTPFWFKLR